MIKDSSTPGATDIAVRAQPRASRTEIVGRQGDRLKVRLAAPPVDGAANKELEKLVAKVLGVPRSSVEVVRGASGRDKTIRVHGMDAAEIRIRLDLP
jgi:uncharacterized protein (TIGR00251 family)